MSDLNKAIARLTQAKRCGSDERLIRRLQEQVNAAAAEVVQKFAQAGDPLGVLHAIRTGTALPIPRSLRQRFEDGDFG